MIASGGVEYVTKLPMPSTATQNAFDTQDTASRPVMFHAWPVESIAGSIVQVVPSQVAPSVLLERLNSAQKFVAKQETIPPSSAPIEIAVDHPEPFHS